MAILSFSNVGITAMTAAVPKRIVNNYKYGTDCWPEDDIRKVVDKIGIFERRFADADTCSSDLCFAAAERLIADNLVDRSEIDLLIFISPTPDFKMPPSSVLLQDRLQLAKTTMAFDVSMVCSAYPYGLSLAYSLMQQPTFRKALLLVGDTPSRVYSPHDRRSAYIFGDAGTATLIERDGHFGTSHFSINSDGAKGDYIKIPAGGYRMPSSLETLQERVVDNYGNRRSDEQGYMLGDDVFNFVISEIPGDIKMTFAHAGENLQDMDYYVFHQANAFMNNYLSKKLKLEKNRILSCIEKFGNTSSASIPLTIVSQLANLDTIENKKFMLSAFGVGMTWATAIVPFSKCKISPLIEL